MKRTRLFQICTLVLVASAVAFAAKPPKPTNTSVSAAFRCQLGVTCDDTDRILGDAGGPYVGNLTTQLGAFLTPTNDFSLMLDLPLNRSLTMDFGAPVGPAPCAARGNCRRIGNFTFGQVTTFSTPYGSAVNPSDAAGTDLPNGLLGITVGSTSNAKVKINFPDPYGRSLIWTVRFNAKDYPGSSYASVTRVGPNTWTVETSAAQLAKLVASQSGGAQQQTDEGLFQMPFKLTIVK